MVDMSKDGICLLDGQETSEEKCKPDCKDCDMYQQYEKERNKCLETAGDKIKNLFSGMWNKRTKFGAALFVLGFTLMVAMVLYREEPLGLPAVELTIAGICFIAWGVLGANP